ncbi:hypothetical protein HPB52_021585 [Rhipicephalus sanguineus]|uniref:Uncharacterized protein n=1 Tax=Rhipicephalus sanguineus TaxID=34632 RepID=A0A9D4T4N9_RHISA|nr:hypothetical protein HPB52_021585 [Rhipicephalus sanguineus]
MAEIQLHLHQRAFKPADGCAENVLLLQTIMDEARHNLVPLATASVDVAKAFDNAAVPTNYTMVQASRQAERLAHFEGEEPWNSKDQPELLCCHGSSYYVVPWNLGKESVETLIDVGLGRHDLKIMAIRCLQGGLRAFHVNERTTAMRPRHL